MSIKKTQTATLPSSDNLPATKAIPATVDTTVTEDDVYETQPDDVHQQTPARDVVKKVGDNFETTVFEDTITPAFLWMLQMFVKIILLHLGTPATTKMLAHSKNADTLLLPAIAALLSKVPAIKELDPRALKGIDLVKVKDKQGLLVQLRQVLKILTVATHSVEAGITQLEQYLDKVIRTIFPRLEELMGDDFQIKLDLDALDKLVNGDAQQAQASQKKNAKIADDATNDTIEQLKDQGTDGDQGQGTPQGVTVQIHGSGTPPTQGKIAPTPPKTLPVVSPKKGRPGSGTAKPPRQPSPKSKRRST